MTWQPKLRPKGFPHSLDDFAIASLTELEHRSRMGDDKRDQRVFRVKRKHVLKACDRCRVKKTKCDGKQPCNRCSVYNHPCLFRERKATQTKVYSRGFVEMLESHHALVVKALQKLYKFCINKEGFPGEPLAEAPDGHPLTHTILDRLGLIKQAEEKADEADEDSEDLRYLRILSSTECSATAEPSPEPTTPQEPSPTTSSRASVCQTVLAPMASRGRSTWQWDMQSVPQTSFSYPGSGFQDFYPSSRPSVGSADLNPGDISPNLDLSSISMISQESQRQDLRSLAYFLDPLCNIESTSSTTGIKHAGRLNHGLEMSETSAQPTGDLSGDLLSDFTFSTHEHALYQGFNSGWTFSSV